jgi:hypothetical protein
MRAAKRNEYIYIYVYIHTHTHTRAIRKVYVHFEYLENRSRGLDVTWQPVRADITVHS